MTLLLRCGRLHNMIVMNLIHCAKNQWPLLGKGVFNYISINRVLSAFVSVVRLGLTSRAFLCRSPGECAVLLRTLMALVYNSGSTWSTGTLSFRCHSTYENIGPTVLRLEKFTTRATVDRAGYNVSSSQSKCSLNAEAICIRYDPILKCGPLHAVTNPH